MSERYFVEFFDQVDDTGAEQWWVLDRNIKGSIASCVSEADATLVCKALNLLDAVGAKNKPADTVGNLSNRYKFTNRRNPYEHGVPPALDYPIERLRESQGRPIHG